ncbi:hypothetical protein QYE76_044260 [Lolium multiflorum]|uniref:CCHC-type domain-containing protein n=1 Tax=Lolium multiflorum TaxID=4521 RepID=A0AAD8TKD0_LOLMU|nr:hypothetical protein QYE76_044260 [Lolium multiflorum]
MGEMPLCSVVPRRAAAHFRLRRHRKVHVVRLGNGGVGARRAGSARGLCRLRRMIKLRWLGSTLWRVAGLMSGPPGVSDAPPPWTGMELCWIRNIRTSDSKINKTPNKMAITGGIRKRITISRTKLNIKLHRSIDRALIPKSSTSKKILNVLFLRDRKAIRSGGNLNAKKIAKRTKISHKKLITKTSLDEGNILRIITSNDHIINIKKKKSTSTRRSVNEKCWIMKTRRETTSSHHRGKALKPGTRGLFETIERTSKTTNRPIGNRIPRRRLHVNLLTQLAIKKSILNIKLGDRPAANRSNSKKDMASSINFNQFLEKEKLKSNGSNFTDWFRHVRIFLNGGNLQYVLDAPLGDPPAETETDEVKNVYITRKTRYSQVQCAILCSLESDLQKRFEHHDPHELIKELKTIFETHAAVECYEASKHFFSCMMEEGSSISEHMLVMTGHAKKLSDLGIVIPNRLGINRVLQSLPPSYKNFVMNYNMQNMNKEFPELFGMLKAAEIEIKKEHQVLMVNKTTSFKKQGKSKGKNKKSGKKAATPPVKPKSGPKPDAECYYCKEKGHWKRNCSKYLADLKSGLIKKKKEEFLTKEVTGRKVELDEIEESLLVDQSSAVPENVPVPPTPATEEANDNDHETSNETATEPRRSTRDRATPDWYDPCLNVMIVDNNDEDPATYEEAMMSPDSNKWQEAMKSEMGSMYDNKVWTLVDLPDSRKAVENKWIFKRKTDADGNITVYKARLVAKGFRQIQGVDYDETFSPVAKLKSVRILLAIAAFFDYEIWQMDVKTAFLNGDIEEELYMVQPKGFVDPKNADKVCKLQRSIYGLKQASRSWNRRFDKVIKDFGFIQCHGEACIYKKVSGSSVAFLILYVDDILLIGNDIELLSSVKGYLNNSFSMKDLGEASYILGIKIYRDRSRRLIGLSQSTYLDKILKKFRMDESKKGFLPMLPGKVLSKTQGPATAEERERMSQIPYASAVGSIMYAMLCTRPDIAHAVSLTSRYQSDPGIEHWTAVKNILKYLKRTKDMFLCYGGDQELVVTSYTDASWNTDPDDSKSQSGYVFILNGAAVSWASSKQCTVAKSSTESEYIAASEASSEAVWMKRFIVELVWFLVHWTHLSSTVITWVPSPMHKSQGHTRG